jgi:hypothetical protein
MNSEASGLIEKISMNFSYHNHGFFFRVYFAVALLNNAKSIMGVPDERAR